MLQLYRFFRGEKGLEQTDIYYQAHVNYQHIFIIEGVSRSKNL